MIKQLSIHILFLFFICNALAQEKVYFDKDWNETTAENAEFYRIIEKKGDLYAIKDFYSSGQLQFEGLARNTKDPLQKEGTCIWYHENGKIAQKIKFKDDQMDGAIIQRYSNGNLKAKGFYINGKTEGVYSEHFPSGEIAIEATFMDGKMHGTFSKYDYNGIVEQQINYKNGLHHGPYKIYEDGKLTYKGDAKNGYQDGTCEEYHYDSDQISKKYTLKDKKLDGTYLEYELDGKKVVEATFSEGIPQSYLLNVSDENGDYFKTKMKVVDGIEEWKSFINDTLFITSFYEKGIRVKTWKLYSFKTFELALTADFSETSCDDGYIQQVTAEDFRKPFLLKGRFQTYLNFVDKFCPGIKFNKILDDKFANFIIEEDTKMLAIPRNEKGEEIVETTKEERVEEEVEFSVIESTESNTEQPDCKIYKDYLRTVRCKLTKDDIKYSLFIGADGKSLQVIKEQNTPKKDEFFVFYQNEYKPVDPNNMYIAFSIPKNIKKAIKKEKMSKQELLAFLKDKLIGYRDINEEKFAKILDEELNK